MSFLRHRPSAAMLVALLALVTAMSGTAVAAVLVSSPDQLADRVVTEPKLAQDSVGSRVLNEPGVFTNNLVNGGVTNAKLATSSVDGRALAFNSVGSSQLVNRQVYDEDLRNPIYSAAVNADGTTSTARSTGIDIAQTKQGNPFLFPGLYTVGFQNDVRNCAFAATAFQQNGTNATVNVNPSNPRLVTVGLSRPTLHSSKNFVEHTGVNAAFNLIAQC